ncbi:MAG TPA: hypothetical protein ENH55_01425 [Aurantimonas coralicida]|uniref:Uncharacterized protein n=1 Tax=marine sediment metagenome TaxID=412755 RepID=A0A0F9P203_9ZZZZ|nr:hypothetical protein [Aurantimonas coralicida]
MLPINKNDVEWDIAIANRMHERIRDEVLTELLARDRKRGIPADGKVTVLDDEHIVIDRSLRDARHTGREHRMLSFRRWVQFCSEPRDEAAFKRELAVADRKQRITKGLEYTAEVAEAVSPKGHGHSKKRKVEV